MNIVKSSLSLSEKVEHVMREIEKAQKAARAKRAGEAARLEREAIERWKIDFEQRWGVKPFNLADATPTLTGGEWKFKTAVSEKYSQFVIQKGKLVEQIFRRPTNGRMGFVDQLTFVIEKQTCEKLFNETAELQSDEDYVKNLSFWLYEIFGFGVSHEIGRSANFYSRSFNLGTHDLSFGKVCIGGDLNPSNESTICVEMTATGLNAAKDDWENRLYRFSTLPEVVGFRYTRVDLAHDFLDGSYNVDKALADYHQGGFTSSIQRPKLRKEGDDWDNDTKKGRTLYIGSRLSSRLMRFYEKGKQLGHSDSPWVRAELELRNRDLIIPLDVILHAGDYLAASYPVMQHIFKTETPTRIEIKERVIQQSVEHVIKYLRMQGSKAINFLKGIGKTDQEILSLFDEDAGIPKKLHPGQFFCDLLNIDFIHTRFFSNQQQTSLLSGC